TVPLGGPFWVLWWIGEKTGVNKRLRSLRDLLTNVLIATDLYLPLQNLVRKPLRFVLTSIAIFVAFLIYVALTSFDDAMNAGVELSADDRLISVNKINFTQPLPISYVRKVETVEGIAAVVHMNWFGGYYQDPRQQVLTFAVDETKLLDVYSSTIDIGDAEHDAWQKNRQGILVGEAIAKTHGWKLGDRIPLSSNIFSQNDGNSTWEFDIEGIYKGVNPQDDTNGVYIHYKYFNETQSFGGDYIGWMGIRTVDPSVNEQVIKNIDEMFVNTPFETETVPEKAFNKSFLAQLGNIGLIVTSVVFAAFFIILVIVGFSMVLVIRERTNEIGVMKTLGFTSGRICKIVLVESTLLTVIGGSAGLFAGTFVLEILNNAPQFPVTVILKDYIVWQTIGLMLFFGFITGIIPARSALKLNIITALSRR
ncbi:MAG: ABC transporter permease, partial [Kordiimonas sp.]